MIGRPKGGKNRKYTVEEKLSIVNMNLQDHMSIIQIEKETGLKVVSELNAKDKLALEINNKSNKSIENK